MAFRAFLQLLRTFVQRAGEQGRPTASRVARITGSTVAAYVAAKAAHHGSDGITGALTALLVVQLTLHSIVRHGWDRVVSVVLGVTVASALSSVTGITWWSLGIAVAASVLAGQMLRVGPNLPEVAISAMLVLSATSGSALAGTDRVIETLIGAAVGVLVNLLFPPADRSQNAGVAIEKYADEVASFLERSAQQLVEGASADQVAGWLTQARQLDGQIANVDRALSQADENRRLNVRSMTKRDPGPALRAGLDALEHCAVSVRSVFRAINDVVHFPDANFDDPYPAEARELMSAVLGDFAHTLRVFGKLVHAQVYGPGAVEEAELHIALTALGDARRQVAEFVRNHPGDNAILQELNVFLVASIGRVLRELNVEGNGWLSRKTYYNDLARHRGVVAVDKIRNKTRHFANKTPVSLRKRVS